MLISEFIIVLFAFSVSHAGYLDNPLNNNEDEVHKRAPSGDKVMADLKNEILILNEANKKILESLEVINRKLDASEKKINDKLEDLEQKFYVPQRKTHGFKERNQENSTEEHKNIKDNMDGKLYSLKKQVLRKIYSPEKIIADKSSINFMNHDHDENQHNFKNNNMTKDDLKTTIKNIICKSETIANTTFKEMKDDEIQKFNVLDTNLYKLENTTSCIIDKKFKKLEEKFNRIFTKLIIEFIDMKESVKYELVMLNKTLLQHSENHVNLKFDIIEKHMISISTKLNILNNTVAQNNTTVKEQSLNKKSTLGFWDCKERGVTQYYFDPFSMDDTFFNYVTYDNSSGATHFEVYFAVKSSQNADILLSSKLRPGYNEDYFAIVIGDVDNTKTLIRIDRRSDFGIKELHRVDTPNILSPTRFTTFYMKIDNGTVELAEKKISLPFLRYTDERLKSVKYISFAGPLYGNKVTNYLYDCPPNFEETLFLYDKCKTLREAC